MAESKPKPATPAEKENDGVKMVQIPESQLSEILHRLDLLTKASDVNRMAYAMGSTDKAPIVRRVNLNVYKDLEKGTEHVILGWQMVIDEVFVAPATGMTHERQVIRLFFENEKGERSADHKDVDYLDFVRRTRKQPAEIVSTTTNDATGETFFKVKRVPDGKEYTVGRAFVN